MNLSKAQRSTVKDMLENELATLKSELAETTRPVAKKAVQELIDARQDLHDKITKEENEEAAEKARKSA